MDKIFEQALLYDFYGELLTSHQQSIYEDAVFHDMSLGEIAQEQGISRQGVHDLIKRCDKILQDYEGKLHLVERFSCAKEKIREIVELTKDAEDEATNLAKLPMLQGTKADQEPKVGRKVKASQDAGAGQKPKASQDAEASQGAGENQEAGTNKSASVNQADSGKMDLNVRMRRIRELSLELMEDW